MEIQSVLDKAPPQNLEAEQSVLGSMMIDRVALEKAVDILSPQDFYREAHQIIYDALFSLATRDEAVDIVTLQEELRTRGQLDSAGGTEYLMALIDSVPTAANIEYYARIVEEKAILRRLIEVSTRIAGWCHHPEEDGQALGADEVADRAERLIFDVTQRRLGEYFHPLRVLAQQAYERMEEQYADKLLISGLPTGFHRLDELTSGLQAADMIVVAGRPSMGKTSLCLDIARHVAVHKRKTVAVFSLEMSAPQLAVRLMCSHSSVNSHRVRTGYLTPLEWRKLADGVGELYEAPIFIDDSTDISVLQIRGKCRRLKAEHGLALVIVDYLQLMRAVGRWRSESRVQEIGEIARGLKSLARELNVPLIALSQLSRAVEHRPDRRPALSDLRESGSIEAEADVVAMLYRKSYYDQKEVAPISDELQEERETPMKGEEDVEETEVIIAKQRNGPTGTIRLNFLPKFASFADIEEHRREPE